MTTKPPRSNRLDTHPELPLDPDVSRPGVYKWPPHFLPRLQVLVFVGGGLGTLARYCIELWLPTSTGGWPGATLMVNIMGAFLLGFLLEILSAGGVGSRIQQVLRLGIGTGFIGGFTTYSAFSVETIELYKAGHADSALLYVLVSIIGGLLACALGIYLASRHRRRAKGVTV